MSPALEPPSGGGERRLRSWLRHERMTVAAELSAALHHSRGEQVKNVGLPAQRRWCKLRTKPHGTEDTLLSWAC